MSSFRPRWRSCRRNFNVHCDDYNTRRRLWHDMTTLGVHSQHALWMPIPQATKHRTKLKCPLHSHGTACHIHCWRSRRMAQIPARRRISLGQNCVPMPRQNVQQEDQLEKTTPACSILREFTGCRARLFFRSPMNMHSSCFCTFPPASFRHVSRTDAILACSAAS